MGFKLKSGNKPSFKNMGSIPVKTTGLGPRKSFGGVKNPEIIKKDKPKEKKIFKDGAKNRVHYDKSASPNKHSHARSSDYWYKIGSKKVTKEEYNKYKNEPGSDKPTKTTNDPDASGRKAATEKARSKNKASKRATVLTKAQTKAKEKDLGPITKKRAEEIAIKKHRENWSPAFPGADHSQEELDKMTEKEKQDYYN